METYYSSVCHSLELLTINNITRFGMDGLEGYMTTKGTPLVPQVTPGRLTVEESVKDGIYTAKLSFSQRKARTAEGCDLSILRGASVVAVYTDENGDRRVAGSPAYPLRATVTATGGMVTVELEGVSSAPILFLAN